MGEKKTTPITINDVDYTLEDMSEEQQAMVNHVADLDRKIASTRFNLDQLSVGREAFMNMLTQQLESDEAVDEEN
ncbi:MAG: hypothetical protein CMJ25_32165 [Phycisphaerae bacterium]|jgi:hypothetical protein|nr:hypothetical protein [Phycisphaerae bacterium]|tara:strand:- start:1243 stop:1467 length:225 start_codon:yes stop_codon:yes gene_type:complete